MEQPTSKSSGRLTRNSAERALLPLIVTSGVAWLFVLRDPVGMSVGPALFVLAWTIMMVAMMLPSAAPLVLLYRRGSSAGQTVSLVSGYLAIWALAGLPAYAAQEWMSALAMGPIPMPNMQDMRMPDMSMADMPMTRAQTLLSAAALAAAGLYQLTPFKAACLKRCRSPADFLMQHWGHGPFRLGLGHGTWCLGCCWALMAVLVLAGMMGLAWVIGIAALVAVEKLAPHGLVWSRVTGVALLLAAVYQGVQ